MPQRLQNFGIKPRTRLRGGGYYKLPIERACDPVQPNAKDTAGLAPRRLISSVYPLAHEVNLSFSGVLVF
jgi:hypothetical protein